MVEYQVGEAEIRKGVVHNSVYALNLNDGARGWLGAGNTANGDRLSIFLKPEKYLHRQEIILKGFSMYNNTGASTLIYFLEFPIHYYDDVYTAVRTNDTSPLAAALVYEGECIGPVISIAQAGIESVIWGSGLRKKGMFFVWYASAACVSTGKSIELHPILEYFQEKKPGII
jgi:hypothetical protein